MDRNKINCVFIALIGLLFLTPLFYFAYKEAEVRQAELDKKKEYCQSLQTKITENASSRPSSKTSVALHSNLKEYRKKCFSPKTKDDGNSAAEQMMLWYPALHNPTMNF